MITIKELAAPATKHDAASLVKLIAACRTQGSDFNIVDLARMLNESLVLVATDNTREEEFVAVGVLTVVQSFSGPQPHVLHFYALSSMPGAEIAKMVSCLIDKGARMARFQEKGPERGNKLVHLDDVVLPAPVQMTLAGKYASSNFTLMYSSVPLIKSRGQAA